MPSLSASDLAGVRIRESRQRRGWNVRELATRCADIGASHITAAVITDLETRRRPTRRITVDELLVLAYVLDVPPIWLFLPLNEGEQLEITPNVATDPVPSALWLAGYMDSPDWPDPDPEQRALRQARSLHTVLPIESLLDVWTAAVKYLWFEERVRRDDFPDQRTRDAVEEGMRSGDLQRRLGKAIDLMLARGLVPPRLPRGLVADLEKYDALSHPDRVPVFDDDADVPGWIAYPEGALDVSNLAQGSALNLASWIIRYAKDGIDGLDGKSLADMLPGTPDVDIQVRKVRD